MVEGLLSKLGFKSEKGDKRKLLFVWVRKEEEAAAAAISAPVILLLRLTEDKVQLRLWTSFESRTVRLSDRLTTTEIGRRADDKDEQFEVGTAVTPARSLHVDHHLRCLDQLQGGLHRRTVGFRGVVVVVVGRRRQSLIISVSTKVWMGKVFGTIWTLSSGGSG